MAKKKEKFEEALQKLEAIVAKMEEGNLPLEEALEAFEEGVKLAKYCTGKLDDALISGSCRGSAGSILSGVCPGSCTKLSSMTFCWSSIGGLLSVFSAAFDG